MNSKIHNPRPAPEIFSLVTLKLPNGEEKIIEIHPGMSFGTGNHVTTRSCIKLLENIFKERRVEKILDIGCGSGILGICSVALGANMILAIDIDAGVVDEAKINVEKNGFSTRIQVLCHWGQACILTYQNIIYEVDRVELRVLLRDGRQRARILARENTKAKGGNVALTY